MANSKTLFISQPYLILLVGIPGAGKTFFGDKFAKTFSTPFLNLNKLRHEIIDEPTFSRDEDEKLQAIAEPILVEMMRSRRAVMIEGALESRVNRAEFRKLARANGYETILVWIQNTAKTGLARSTRQIKYTPRRKLITPEDFDRITKRFTAPNVAENPVVISGNHTFAMQAKIVLKRIAHPEQNIRVSDRPNPNILPKRHLIR